MKKGILFLFVVFAAASLTLAGRYVDETKAADPDAEIEIELISGSVHVIGWDKDEVRVTGTLGDDVEELEFESDGDEISIEVVLPDGARSLHDANAVLEIYVPSRSTVEVEAVSADITVESMRGSLEAESVSGDVTISGSLREVEAGSVSGDVMVSSDEPLRDGDFESVSGDLEVRAPLSPGGDFSFETVSGDVTLRLPSDTSAEFDIETFSGRIINEFGGGRYDDDEKRVEFSTGAGEAHVEIEAFSGKIKLLMD